MAGPEPQPQTPDPSLLTLLGLDAEQDAVYRRLVDHPDCDPAALTSSSDAGEDEIRRHLDALVGRGLAGVDRDEAGGGTTRRRRSSRSDPCWKLAGPPCTRSSSSSPTSPNAIAPPGPAAPRLRSRC